MGSLLLDEAFFFFVFLSFFRALVWSFVQEIWQIFDPLKLLIVMWLNFMGYIIRRELV